MAVDFTAAGQTYKSFSSDISKKGLFIRTNRAFETGSDIGIQLYLPDGSIAFLKGRVMRAIKTPLQVVKNGMGIELTEVDENFKRFIKSEYNEEFDYTSSSISAPPEDKQESTAPSTPKPDSDADEAIIIRCSNCNAKNKIRRSKLHLGPKCGKCKIHLPT